MTAPLPSTPSRETERFTAHLNLRWNMADIDRIEALAVARNSAQHIATVMNCTSAAILTVCRRNGFAIGRL